MRPAPKPALRRAPLVASVASALALVAPAARAGDFMDTRLTFTLGDDDVLHKTGEAQPLSPNASIGDRPQYRLFFDNLNSRFSGRENITHLVMYKKMPGYIERLDTEASLVLRVDLAQLSSNSNNLNAAFYDAGSFLRLLWHASLAEGHEREGLDITLFPLDTDRFRLGYLYDISWGGTAASINQSLFPRIQGTAPGMKIGWTGDGWYAYGGLKTASIVQEEQQISSTTGDATAVRIAQTNYGFLGGAGVDAAKFLRVDAGAGYFQQGKFDLPDVLGKSVYTYGVSGRVVVHQHMPVPQSVDFLLYRNDPNAPLQLFAPEKYDPNELAWAVSVEATQLEQNLKDFDRPRATALQAARAGAAQVNLKAGYLRASVTGIYRDLPYVVRNQPGYIPFETMPRDAKTSAEKFFAAAVDYYLASLHLRPGIGAGLQMPATFRSVETDIFGAPVGNTVVVRQQGNIALLPQGKDAKPILQSRASLRWDISDIMSAVAWVQLVHDPNQTLLDRTPDGTASLRTFLSPNFLGGGVSMQARF